MIRLLGLLRHTALALGLLDEWVLDCEAPDIEVIAYRGDNVKLEETKISKLSRARETTRRKHTTKLPYTPMASPRHPKTNATCPTPYPSTGADHRPISAPALSKTPRASGYSRTF